MALEERRTWVIELGIRKGQRTRKSVFGAREVLRWDGWGMRRSRVAAEQSRRVEE